MNTQQYIDNLNKRFQTGISREHAYRGDLQLVLETLLKDVQVINEPARIECGAPDYILTRKDIPVGYIEAKDVGVDLNSKSLKEQFDRYRASLTNLIFTDYLDFHFYRDGVFVNSIRIAEISNGAIVGKPDQYAHFEQLMKDFAQTISQTIKSPTKLAEMMAGKARLLANIIEQAVSSDEENEANSQLKDQYKAFQNVLVHDITHKAFADMYAQTIAYGMFAARYHDPTIPTFSREEAATLIPHSNPFLRKLFQSIAGYDLDARIAWIVDDLVQIFLASDVAVIMRNFGKSTKQDDPIIHFYETFLAAYDPSLRKSRGVWYTPEPVVNFIVRAVDDILKTEFNLPQGLADTSKTKIKVDYQGKKIEQEVHKVQVLDPATGTGTFLAEVIKHIHQKFKNQAGIWPKYVENDLIPRLNGFELLMTSYAMAHLKMDILLTETGFTNPNNKRFKIFLTNSLEEPHDNQFNLFTQWLSQEANEANAIKKDTPVMCVIGNPPYAVSSTNKGPWIQNLIADYKKDLKERKINLDDDYIKFIRYGQHFIDKNGEGILAYISANSFIDGVTHRQMRKHLLESFDKIYIIDLHGNSKKKEICPDGSPDQNVFDIMTGVSINIFIKTGKKKKNELGKILHFDLFGKRNEKYQFLNENSINDINYSSLNPVSPNFFFTQKNMAGINEYEKGFKIDDLLTKYVSGFQTKRDKVTINLNEKELLKVKEIFTTNTAEEIRSKLSLPEDGRDWTIEWAKNDLVQNNPKTVQVMYRPFDDRYTFYTGKSKGFIAYPRDEMYTHLGKDENLSLITCRQQSSFDFQHVFVSRLVSDMCNISSQTKETGYIFPLYIYPETNVQQSIDSTTRKVNLNFKITSQITSGIKHTFIPDDETIVDLPTNSKGVIYPLDILDYIYAVLHSPSYREKYKEFLKIDFPRVPYPTDADKFWELVALGRELREIHLLESPKVEEYITGYPEDGDNVVGKPIYKNGSVYINETQYFSNVPEVAWNFYIGGYQPAQKWLKDRKDRELSYDDILHYQKIIVALTETDRIMKEIDEIEI
jgi:predicted helicase